MSRLVKRVALCLYGRFNNRYSADSGVGGFEYITAQILSNPDAQFDVFIYSNDLEYQDAILELYGSLVRVAVFEPQPTFEEIIQGNQIDLTRFEPLESFRTLQNTLSLLHSRWQSVNQMDRYSKSNSIEYDAVICCRFDLGQIDRINGRHPFRVSEINFDPNLDMNYVYAAMWNQQNAGLADQWFYSSPENMLRVAGMYERVPAYFSAGSDYLNDIGNGVPDSNDRDEFSNELFIPLSRKSKSLVKVEQSAAINNHLLHKYFFYSENLIEITKFVSDLQGIARVTYTHSDYKDVWPLYFGQISKFYSGFQSQYVLVNEYSKEIPPNFKQIVYDDKLAYVDRLLTSLDLIPNDTIFFEHEDMVLLDYPNNDVMQDLARAVQAGPFDYAKTISGGSYIAFPYMGAKSLSWLSKFSKWTVSIQPSFWNRTRFIELLKAHRGKGIWEFEELAQATSRRIRLKGAVPRLKGKRRGKSHWDSIAYPFIATAVVKGKWNYSEYESELTELLREYGIDSATRGHI